MSKDETEGTGEECCEPQEIPWHGFVHCGPFHGTAFLTKREKREILESFKKGLEAKLTRVNELLADLE